jgi:two-component SAPR family response regulator
VENTNCYIVDEEYHSIQVLSHYIEKTEGLLLKQTFTDASLALSTISNEQNPALTFLDLNIAEISPIEFAKMISPHSKIVFTSTLLSKIRRFHVDELDYLRKPISYELFLNKVRTLI